MSTPYAANLNAPTLHNTAQNTNSAVSWSAIFAGAAAAAVLSLILLILGTGLGLSSVSPWAQSGISAVTFGISTIIWLTLTQLIASGMGGYLAGRLRTRWAGIQNHEVFFRDTAHGFLAWAVSALITAAMLTSAIASIVGGGVSATASVAGGAVQTAMTAAVGGAVAGSNAGNSSDGSDSLGGLMDGLFRKNPTANSTGTPNATAPTNFSNAIPEVSRIFMRSLGAGSLSPVDLNYIGQLVAQRTELSQQDAEKRVTETYAAAQVRLQEAQTATKDAADKARKASATAALWLFITLLIGAFSASLAAVYGGRRRDL